MAKDEKNEESWFLVLGGFFGFCFVFVLSTALLSAQESWVFLSLLSDAHFM